jgi:hypothetical protein
MGFIYWIASYPKSGNTWTRAFLTSLITGGLQGDLSKLGEIIPDENSGTYYKRFLRKPIAEASNFELAMIRPQAHHAMAQKAQNFLLLKTHSMVAIHNGTHTVTPSVTAGAIYLLRNPLDVAVSYSDFRSRDVDRTIALMHESGRELARPPAGAYEVVGSWRENVESWTKPHRGVVVVRYEDLLDNPKEQFGRIVKFLKMDASEQRIDRAIQDASFENLKATEQRAGFQEYVVEGKSFFRSGRTGEWRERLSEEQVASIVRRNQEPMKRFGYWLDEFDDLVKPTATLPASEADSRA